MITLPQLSEADPEVAGEGSIDPLGLATMADRLADRLVPGVTARMQRIRFVTAIALGALVTEDLWDLPSADGVSTPQICFEWHVLEAFVRRPAESGVLSVTGIPGSSKATFVIQTGKRLTAANYLKSPQVFGFSGVYQPLARGLRITDSARLPAERAIELIEAWQEDQGLNGFVNSTPGSPGASLRGWLRDGVVAALRQGRCGVSPSSHLWNKLARTLAPLGAGRRERDLLRNWLLDPDEPIRTELARSLALLPPEGGERVLLERLRRAASLALRQRIDAIQAFERFSALLNTAFNVLRYVSTHSSQPLTGESVRDHETLLRIAVDLPQAFASASVAAEPLELAAVLTDAVGAFGEPATAPELVDRILLHHERVQRAKGKLSWFEEYGVGVYVRQQYRVDSEPELEPDALLHPFRVAPMRQFLADIVPLP